MKVVFTIPTPVVTIQALAAPPQRSQAESSASGRGRYRSSAASHATRSAASPANPTMPRSASVFT